MASGQILEAASRGLQGLGTPTSRAEARLRKSQADAELAKLNLKKEAGVDKQEIDLLKQQNEKLLADGARAKTYDAFRAYNSDYNPRHLNRALQDPVVKNLFPDVVAVDKINPSSDQDLIQKSGLSPGLFTDSDIGPNASARFVKVIKQDGTMEISDLVNLQAATGYTQYMSDKELADFKTRSEITKNLKAGAGQDTTDVKNAAKWGDILEKLRAGNKLTPEEEAFNKLMIDKTQGNVAGQLDEVQKVTQSMLNSVGGDEGWQKLNMQDRATRLKVGPSIERIEKLGGLSLSSDDRKIITSVNKLLTLGEPAAKLTENETGIMDNLWFKMKKYVPGSVTDADMQAIKASSGYAAFQNELRKVLYGSVLTPGEIEKFNSAYGTLQQQFPEVMAQFKTMLGGLRSDIESISNLNNPYVIEYRLGNTQDRVDNLISNIDNVLSNITTHTKQTITAPNSPATSPATSPAAAPKPKVDLNRIFR